LHAAALAAAVAVRAIPRGIDADFGGTARFLRRSGRSTPPRWRSSDQSDTEQDERAY